MIFYKTEEEIELIRESSLLVAKTHAEMAKLIEPGVTTLELDKVAESFIRDHGGIPGFKGYNGFPNTLCVSPNEQVVHGIPNDSPLESGSILSLDSCSNNGCPTKVFGIFSLSKYFFSKSNNNKI